MGCPISKLPNYKAHVIQRLPKIQSLDGVKIEPENRKSADLTIQKERSMMAILIHNECLMHKLVATPLLKWKILVLGFRALAFDSAC